jgi:hypothetical protein
MNIALRMIAHNEGNTILTAINSAAPLVSHAFIQINGDMPYQDPTYDAVCSLFGDDNSAISGTITGRPFTSFCVNRNSNYETSFDGVTFDFDFWMDAKDVIECENPQFVFDQLKDATSGMILVKGYDDMITYRRAFTKHNWGFTWKGSAHEYISSPNDTNCVFLEGISLTVTPTGASGTSEQKYHRYVSLLKQDIDPRTLFYLGQSDWLAGNTEGAITWYKARVEMLYQGFDEEAYMSLICLYRLTNEVDWLFKAYEFRPSFGEAVYWLTVHFQSRGLWTSAYPWTKLGLSYQNNEPKGRLLWYSKSYYEYECVKWHFVTCTWLDNAKKERKLLYDRLLSIVPDHEKELVEVEYLKLL